MEIRIWHEAGSRQSSQASNAVRLAQRIGASGPSRARMTCPIMISLAGLDRAYPPFGPFFERRKPLLRSSSRIVSRNYFEILFRVAMSVTKAVCPGSRPARSTSAFRPYLPFLVSIVETSGQWPPRLSKLHSFYKLSVQALIVATVSLIRTVSKYAAGLFASIAWPANPFAIRLNLRNLISL